MAYPKFHGIQLAISSAIENLHFERLAVDPSGAGLAYPGRFWFNTAEKVVKYTTFDTDGVTVVVRAIVDAASLQTAITDLQTTLTTDIEAVDGRVTQEITDRQTAITTLQTALTDAIAQEVIDRNNAIAAAAAEKVSKSGDTMTGNLVMQAGSHITITDVPSNSLDATNVAYVDARINGLKWKTNAELATTENIDLTVTVAPTVDGIVVPDGARVLVKNQTIATQNGIYVFTAGVGFVRAEDADEPVELSGAAILVRLGATQENTSWTCPLDATAVVGTDPITFVQHNGSSGVVPGVGLTKTGNQIDVNLGAGISQLPTDEVGIDVRATGGLFLTEDGTTESTSSNAQLAVKLDGDTLTSTASGVKVSDAVIARITSAEGDIDAVEGRMTTAEGEIDTLQTDLADAKTELDATQTGAGLGADGTYAANATSNYLAAATSLKDADNKLDAELKTVADALAAEVTRATDAEAALDLRLDTVEAAAGSGAAALKTAINDGRYTYKSTVAATSHLINHGLNAEFISWQVMVEGTDGKYRFDIVPVEEVDFNNIRIDLSEARNVKVCVINAADLA